MRTRGFSFLFVLILLLSFGTLKAGDSDNFLIIAGTVEEDGDAIPSCAISVTTNAIHTSHSMTDDAGNFELKLRLGNVYSIVFTKDNYVTKQMYVDARHPEAIQMKTDFEFPDNVKVDLFKSIEGTDMSAVSAQPLVKIRYNKPLRRFEYDEEYMAQREGELEIVWERVQADRKERKSAYDDAMEQARAAFSSKDFSKANEFYQAALKARPFSSEARLMAEETEKLSGRFSSVSQDDLLEDSYMEEIKSRNNKTITRRIVVLNKVKTIYTKVEHHTGQVFYFKNSQPVTSWIWEKETQAGMR